MYHKKMLDMWANRYIDIARKQNTNAAREWAANLIPSDAVHDVKKMVEQKLGIKR